MREPELLQEIDEFALIVWFVKEVQVEPPSEDCSKKATTW
jgi:hypothetical protein